MIENSKYERFFFNIKRCGLNWQAGMLQRELKITHRKHKCISIKCILNVMCIMYVDEGG